MPVTARLSKSFYDRFGDDIANELVEWFNSVDATYRSDLREFNEMNFARFDAKLEQRLGELGARIDALEKRMDERFAALEKESGERFSAFEDRIGRLLAERLGASESRMRNWMIGFCTTQLFALVGLIYTILHGR